MTPPVSVSLAPRGEYQLFQPPAALASARGAASSRSSAERLSGPPRPGPTEVTGSRVPLVTTAALSALALVLLTLSAPAAASQRGVPGGTVTPSSSAPAHSEGHSDGRLSSLTPAPFVSKCRGGCGNGQCDESAGQCQCHPGWRGPDCSLCGGKIK